METPNKEIIEKEMEKAWRKINFRSPDWQAFEEYLGWRQCSIAFSCLEANDERYQYMARGKSAFVAELLRYAQLSRESPQPLGEEHES